VRVSCEIPSGEISFSLGLRPDPRRNGGGDEQIHADPGLRRLPHAASFISSGSRSWIFALLMPLFS